MPPYSVGAARELCLALMLEMTAWIGKRERRTESATLIGIITDLKDLGGNKYLE